jgi:hypothetical protein
MEVAIYNLLSAIANSLLYVNYAVSDVNSSIYETVTISFTFLVQFSNIFTYITAFSSSSETFFCEKMLALFDQIM